MEKEARDKFDEEGGEASQSYTILLVRSKEIGAIGFHKAIVKMAERASNVANDWTKGRGGRGGAKEKDILEKLDNDV